LIELKFPTVLDDNFYTNKTWAHLSGISVTELHVMEIEFLTNTRYSLSVTKEEWREWQVKIDLFLQYFAKALQRPAEQSMPSAMPHSPRQSISFTTSTHRQPEILEKATQGFPRALPPVSEGIRWMSEFNKTETLYVKRAQQPYGTVLANQASTTPSAIYNRLTASPFERWSQRYDPSPSPDWFRGYMTPRNPLRILSPCPIGTPWNRAIIPNISSLTTAADATAHKLESHQMNYRHVGSSKDDVQIGFVPRETHPARDCDWTKDLPLSDENTMTF
jgi:hypothetical protein